MMEAESPSPVPIRGDSDELSSHLFDLDRMEHQFFQPSSRVTTPKRLSSGDSFDDLVGEMFRENSNGAASLNNGVLNDEFVLPEREEEKESINQTSPTSAFSLRQWINVESFEKSFDVGQDLLEAERSSLMRKLLVAYAIGKVLEHLKIAFSSYSQKELEKICSVDNFSIHTSSDFMANLVGVEMISPCIYLCIKASQFSRSGPFANENGWGLNVEAVITRHCAFCCATKAVIQGGEGNDKPLCYVFGLLLYHLFSGESFTGSDIKPSSHCDEFEFQHRSWKSTCRPSSIFSLSTFTSSSVTRLIENLIECNSLTGTPVPVDAYSCLEAAISDLNLLLREPNMFLFDNDNTSLKKGAGRIYGRADEIVSLHDVYGRVVSSNNSEAVLIGGYSGSGKTRLALSLPQSDLFANGLCINTKFEETASEPLALLLSAFDEMFILIADKNTAQESHSIYQALVTEFGSHFYLLVRTVPNVLRLSSSETVIHSIINDAVEENEINFFSICEVIKRLMRIVSSHLSSSVMIFVDDLHWADPVSLGLIHTVLSDPDNSILFVGTYRDNEVPPSHIIFGFCEWLVKFKVVPLKTIQIQGLLLEDINFMVSDSLGTFPCLCESLSRVVLRKTKGNPFFVRTFLSTLVGKQLLQYNLRAKRWEWDIEEILAEDVTPNVLDLITAKMNELSENIRAALKTASCFGIKMHDSIVHHLSQQPQYSNLRSNLMAALDDGLVELDSDGSSFRFVHDKVREAAYDMINSESKDKFHFDIGMVLLASYEQNNTKSTSTLYAILDQINHGILSLQDEAQHISIAKLNLQAGMESLRRSNYTSAYNFAKSAVSLLPNDSPWAKHYDLCLKLYFLLSRAAYSYRKIDEAKDATNIVINHANTLQDKLDAYTIQHMIILVDCDPDDANQLIVTMLGLLQSLGEHIPCDEEVRKDIARQIDISIKSFQLESDDKLLNMHDFSSEKYDAIMQAYTILVSLGHIAKPQLYAYYVARWSQFCLKHKVASKYVPLAYVFFAAVLCTELNETSRVGYRIGRLGLKMSNQNDSNSMPLIYLLYYGYVGIVFEPLQAVIEMHRQAYDVGLRTGNSSIAGIHKVFTVAREFFAGTNLVRIKDEIEYVLKSEEYHGSMSVFGMKLGVHHQAVKCLINGDKESSITKSEDESLYDNNSTVVVYQMVISVYFGYFERVRHLAKRWEKISGINHCKKMVPFRVVYVYFYWGLASLVVARRKACKLSDIDRLISIVENASGFSTWNFRNKVALLKALRHSLHSQNTEAEAAFQGAVEFSQASKFVHEEGLCHELAGMHYEGLGKFQQALTSFHQAEKCYRAWGSQMKVNKTGEKILHVSHQLT